MNFPYPLFSLFDDLSTIIPPCPRQRHPSFLLLSFIIHHRLHRSFVTRLPFDAPPSPLPPLTTKEPRHSLDVCVRLQNLNTFFDLNPIYQLRRFFNPPIIKRPSIHRSIIIILTIIIFIMMKSFAVAAAVGATVAGASVAPLVARSSSLPEVTVKGNGRKSKHSQT